MTDREAAKQTRTRIFLSYSRADANFLSRLAASLEELGYEPVFDRSERPHDDPDVLLSAQDEWWSQLEAMIAASDVMVFIVSPRSAASEVCDDEIAHARNLGKRIIAVKRSDIDFNRAPKRLRALNVKIDFSNDDPAAYSAAMASLSTELKLDIDWHRRGTRLMRQAQQWHADGKPEGQLLRAGAIEEADAWILRRPPHAPDPGPALIEFLDASRRKERQDQLDRRKVRRRAVIAVGLTSTAVIAGVISYTFEFEIRRVWVKATQIDPYRLSADEAWSLAPGDSFRECGPEFACPEMVVVPAGSFQMGSPSLETARADDEGPQRTIAIGRFAVGKFEITHQQWDACVQFTRQAQRAAGERRTGCAPISDSGLGREDRPAINLSWADAHGYVAWLNAMTNGDKNGPYRLLTEAEWEYAARAGTPGRWPWGEDETATCKHANVANPVTAEQYGLRLDHVPCLDPFVETAPVGSFASNAFDLFDMHGNVFEWVEDCYRNTLEGQPPAGEAVAISNCPRPVVRGASWLQPPKYMRSADRHNYNADMKGADLGFRIARSL